MQQASVEKFSDLIGAIYDCVIAPERWTGVLNEIRTELGFATAVLSAYSLTNMRIGVNAASGTDPVQTMARPASSMRLISSHSGAALSASVNIRLESRSFDPRRFLRKSS